MARLLKNPIRLPFNGGPYVATAIVAKKQKPSTSLLEKVGSENKDLRDLIQHCWVHDNYRQNGYLEMTTMQKKLYCRIIGAEFDPLAPIFKE